MKLTFSLVSFLICVLSTLVYWQSQPAKVTLDGHRNDVMSLAFSSDGKTLVSGSIDRTAIIWDIQTAQIKQRFTKHKGWVWSLSFSPDQTMVASASFDDDAWVWDAQTGQPRQQLKPNPSSLVFAERGEVLVGASGKLLYTWNTQTWKRDRILSAHTEPIYVITLSNDGRFIASGDMSGQIILWEVKNWQPVQKIRMQNWIKSLSFFPDGSKLVVGSALIDRDGTQSGGDVDVLSLSNQSSVRLLRSAGVVWSVAVSPNGKLIASAGKDGQIRIWDAQTEKLKGSFDAHTKLVSKVAFSPDGSLLASCGGGGAIRLWGMNSLY